MQANYELRLTADEFDSITKPKQGGGLTFVTAKPVIPPAGKRRYSDLLKTLIEAVGQQFDPGFQFSFEGWHTGKPNAPDMINYGRCQHQPWARSRRNQQEQQRQKQSTGHVIRMAKTTMEAAGHDAVFHWEVKCRQCRGEVPAQLAAAPARPDRQAAVPAQEAAVQAPNHQRVFTLQAMEIGIDAAPIEENVAGLQAAFVANAEEDGKTNQSRLFSDL